MDQDGAVDLGGGMELPSSRLKLWKSTRACRRGELSLENHLRSIVADAAFVGEVAAVQEAVAAALASATW